ncbi:MAG: Gfo/Idh/MocA family oxidoreductase [Fuerstiella sp.]|nr:Gfo/Idh/MocA family oxidoreductase [Fuerstiella sp.]MCP4787662.1 Gfo/Idh/MocA family oxidoreductase [Fuerstiella sp.]MCP4856854.1 Gfo/Idh/MocA family oxidoreductase [Fuerstiella sp.]
MKQILIIGGGSIGERHVRCFQKTGRANVVLCETNEELRQQISTSYRLSDSFKSLDDALIKRFDGAVICTPAQLHIPMAQRLMERGIAPLIEKPLSISLDGISDLQAAVDGSQLPVSVAYVMRQHPALVEMKNALDAEAFGRPVQVVYTGGQHFPFYRPAYREIYYTRHETGGGAIQDALTHVMNTAEWIVGPVTRLVADAEHCVLDGVNVEDTAHVITRHETVLGSFSLNQHQPVSESRLTVVCERGAARFEGHRSRWLSSTQPDGPWQVENEFALERDDLFVRQADAFLDQLNDEALPVCSLDEALQTLKVCLAALHSVRTEQWVQI